MPKTNSPDPSQTAGLTCRRHSSFAFDPVSFICKLLIIDVCRTLSMFATRLPSGVLALLIASGFGSFAARIGMLRFLRLERGMLP